MQVSKLNQSQKDDLLQYLLFREYQQKFEIIDGLNQHPKGLTFDAWLEHTLERAGI